MISERYSRNIGAISEAEQETLLGRRVLVAGGGGLGGNVIAGLLRIGVGGVTLVDFDRFDETNLNRQLLCTLPDIGRAKADAAAEYAAAVNPDVRFTAVRERLDGISCRRLLSGHDLAIDALDNAESRADLAAACRGRVSRLSMAPCAAGRFRSRSSCRSTPRGSLKGCIRAARRKTKPACPSPPPCARGYRPPRR